MKRKLSIFLTLVFVFTTVLGGFGAVVAQADSVDYRISGADRYSTAHEIAKQNFETADAVIIVRGDSKGGTPNVVDGLTASVLAGAKNAPILLTAQDQLPEATKAAITDLKATKAYIIGGKVAISEEVEAAIKELGLEVERVSGQSREETAVEVAKAANTGSKTAIIAQSRALVDSLVAGPLAFANQYPILLVGKDAVGETTDKAIKDLGIENLIIIGGKGVVSSEVETALKELVKGDVERLAGNDRVLTSLAVAKEMDSKEVALVNGWSFVDAVAASTLGLPIIYVQQDKMHADVEALLAGKTDVKVIGGPVAIKDVVVGKAVEALNRLDLKVASVKAINATTIQITFAEGVKVTEQNLMGTEITLKDAKEVLTAKYQADSLLNGVASFELVEGKLVDAVIYTAEAKWAKFEKAAFEVRIQAPYINEVIVTTTGVPAGSNQKVYFSAKNQYGEEIEVDNTIAKDLAVSVRLNGMPLTANEFNLDRVNSVVNITRSLAEGNAIVLTFTNKIGQDTKEVGSASFTVVKAADPIATTIGNIRAIFTDGPDVNKEAKTIAANDQVKLTVQVKDQFGNLMTNHSVRWVVEKGATLITGTATPTDGVEYAFTANKNGEVVISAFLANGQKATFSSTIGASKLSVLTITSENTSGNNNEEVVLGKVEPNAGAILTPDMLRFNIVPQGDLKITDIQVSARLRGGNVKDKENDIVVVATTSKKGTFQVTPYVGASFTDEKVIKPANGFALTTAFNSTVASIEVEGFKANELTAGTEVKKEITFKNKHGEVINVTKEQLSILPTSGIVVRAIEEKGFVTEIGFKASAKGNYTVTFVSGAVSTQVNVVAVDAAKLTTVNLGNNITSGVIAGKINGVDAKPFVRTITIKDQYGNDLIPQLPTIEAHWINTTDAIANFVSLQYYKLNDKKEVELLDNSTNAVGVALVVDANALNNTTDKIATVTVKDGDKVLDTVNVTVKAVRKVSAVELKPEVTNIALTGQTTLKVEVKDQYGDLINAGTVVKSNDDVVKLGDVVEAKNNKNEVIPGTYLIAVDGVKLGTQEVTINIVDGENKVLATAKTTFKVDAAGNMINSIAIDESKVKELYYTGTAEVKDEPVALQTIIKDAIGNLVAVNSNDLNWSVVEAKYTGSNKDYSGTVTVDNGVVTAADNFVGTATIKVITSNLKEATITLVFSNAERAAVLSTLEVVTVKEGKYVAVESPVKIEKNNDLVVRLVGKDQYGKEFVVESGVLAFSENTAIATVLGSGAVTVEAVELGTAKINLVYRGTAFSFTVEVIAETEK